MKIKHTSGPWHIGALDNGDILGPIERSCSPVICKMPVWWKGKQFGEHISQDLQRANARLIAAAPDLLEACELAIVELRPDGENAKCCQAFNALTKAVKKATD